ncbi:mitochondrial 39-S ribosomal protein L47 (MRP-L47)-domain-containing protein [Syncephalis plumigaleata]|nr:mitochondrial 39-S ribosomal protein L47 (MRP-L47)-domain-containing protein [Syncephalis plumigaleata]
MLLWTRQQVRPGVICRALGAGLVRPLALFSTGRPTLEAVATTSKSTINSADHHGEKDAKQRHGLWDFFEDGQALPKSPIYAGRAWRAAELRQKSFEDLHKLWFIILKERNVLASQHAEAKRYGLTPQQFTTFGREVKCRKSMARILTVLRERHLAYERAVKRHRREEFKTRREAIYKAMLAAKSERASLESAEKVPLATNDSTASTS